ncbi:MAG: hypothetical protein R6X06_01995, partial [Gammaproteobacteria bacterium]
SGSTSYGPGLGPSRSSSTSTPPPRVQQLRSRVRDIALGVDWRHIIEKFAGLLNDARVAPTPEHHKKFKSR